MFGRADEVEKNKVCPGLEAAGTVAAVSEGDASGGSLRHLIMSTRTRGVAVAVNAIIGTEGRMSVSLSHFSSLYAGRKSWPHSLSYVCMVVEEKREAVYIPDAMCFINCHSNELALLVDSGQHLPEWPHGQELWSDIEQACGGMAAFEVIFDTSAFGDCRAPRYRLCRDAQGRCRVDLICLSRIQELSDDGGGYQTHHQRQQRRHDNGD